MAEAMTHSALPRSWFLEKLEAFNGIHFRNLQGDIRGGVIASIVALPLALAFGVASGAGPVAGIWCAIFCGFLASIFGGTPTQISGPTGPLAIVMAGLIAQYMGHPGVAFTVVIMGGIFQVVFGMLKLGQYVSLIPFPVVTGFMSAIGVIIIVMQLPALIGLIPPSGGVKESFKMLAGNISHTNYWALAIGLLAFAIMNFTPRRVDRYLPAPLIALVGGSVLALFSPEPSPIIGAINGNPPHILMPAIDTDRFGDMVFSALVIAFLSSMNSLLASLVADNMTGKIHKSDREMIGQGLGNMVSGLFGVMPGAGATMRTAANIRAGGRTPVSSIVHCAVLLAVVLGLAPLASSISYAVLGGILMKVGMDIIDWNFLKKIHRVPRSAAVFMLVVFVLTIFVNHVIAVGVGMVLASLLLAKQLADAQNNTMQEIKFSNAEATFGNQLNDEEMLILKTYPGKVALFEMSGALSYGAARNMARRLRAVGNYEALVLDFSNVHIIDSTSILALEEIMANNKERKKKMIVFGLKPAVRAELKKNGVIEYIEEHYIHKTRLQAMRHAREIAENCTTKA